MSKCLYLVAATDLLLTTLRAVNFAQGNKNPGLAKCWKDSNYDPIPVTAFCLVYNALNSRITFILFVLRSLFAIIIIIQRWRYPQCVMFTWITSQFTELSMQVYTCVDRGFWHMDPYALLQFTFKIFIMWTFMSPREKVKSAYHPKFRRRLLSV
jgi:hypothetical protein